MWTAKSYYSLLYGTLTVEQLVEMAKAQGLESLALTDINTSQGVMDFYKQCQQSGIKPLAGVEFRDENQLLFTTIAKNVEGFREINELLTQCKEQKSMLVGKTVKMLGVLVHIKYVRTKRGELMHFGTFIDLDGQYFDTLHFPDTLSHWPFKGTGVYLLQGTVTEEFGQPSITVSKMAKLEIQPDPRMKK